MADTPPEWIDDLSIADDEQLLRRVPPQWITEDTDGWDQTRSGFRPLSQAFDNDAGGGPMSVYLESELRRVGLDAHAVLIGFPPGWGVAMLPAGAARKHSQIVARDPLNVGSSIDLAHAVVVGSKNGRRRKRLQASACWAIPGNSG